MSRDLPARAGLDLYGELSVSRYAKPGEEKLVHDELLELVEPTRVEEGCIQHDLHRDNSSSGHFLFYENWPSREQWQAHMQAPHLAACMTATEGAIDRITLDQMERLA